jgi:hypothetical protein
MSATTHQQPITQTSKRTKAARAKANGLKLGRTPELTPHQRREAIKRCDAGEPTRYMARSRNVTFSAAGIIAYLGNGGSLENAAVMANHASTRTTQLYNCRREDVSLDEVERISI